jgi:hypothetical protein
MWLIAALTFGSGLVSALRMSETLPTVQPPANPDQASGMLMMTGASQLAAEPLPRGTHVRDAGWRN